MSPAAVRMRSETPPDDPISANPTITGTACSVAVPRRSGAADGTERKPTTITGTREPVHRPAGREGGQAEAVRKIAGPEADSASKPVTRTNVSEETAATS
jgi:hypothetical protein